jgi:hypothetical protein
MAFTCPSFNLIFRSSKNDSSKPKHIQHKIFSSVSCTILLVKRFIQFKILIKQRERLILNLRKYYLHLLRKSNLSKYLLQFVNSFGFLIHGLTCIQTRRLTQRRILFNFSQMNHWIGNVHVIFTSPNIIHFLFRYFPIWNLRKQFLDIIS